MRSFWAINKQGEMTYRDLVGEEEAHHKTGYMHPDRDQINVTFHEIFKTTDRGAIGCEYERGECRILPGDTVIDIGANIGLFAIHAVERGAKRVICFEPQRSTFECLLRNISGLPVIAYNVAISNKRGAVALYVPRPQTVCTVGYIFTKLYEGGYVEQVPAFTLSDFMKWENLDTVDFLKMDVEGAEIDIFKGLPKVYLDRIKKMAIEFHHRPGLEYRASVCNLYDRLAFNGFRSMLIPYGGNEMLHLWRK